MKILVSLLQLARPKQYVKNAFIFLPLFFGHKLLDGPALMSAGWTFLAFCLTSSSVYVFNDWRDIEEDRIHPVKCARPLARGALSVSHAFLFMAGMLVVVTLLVALFLPAEVGMILVGYLVLNVFYTFGLKHIALIDVTCIAVGFVLRVLVGGVAADVEPSHWIMLMTFLLALFLALGKRYDDLLIAATGKAPRKCLSQYNLDLVQSAMVVMAAVTIVCYIMYAVAPETVAYYDSKSVYLSTFWVILGILRYLQLTMVQSCSGSPTEVLYTDRFLQLLIAGWLLTLYFFLYMSRH